MSNMKMTPGFNMDDIEKLDTFRIYSGSVPSSADDPLHEDLLREDLLVEMTDCRMEHNPYDFSFRNANPAGWSSVVLNSGEPSFIRFTSSEGGFGVQGSAGLIGCDLNLSHGVLVKGRIFMLPVFIIRIGLR